MAPLQHRSRAASYVDKAKRSAGLVQASGHLGIWVLTGTLVYLFWLHQQWLAFAFALFAHGTVASFFVGVAPHELGHCTVFRTRKLNKVFLYIYSLLSWWDPFDTEYLGATKD